MTAEDLLYFCETYLGAIICLVVLPCALWALWLKKKHKKAIDAEQARRWGMSSKIRALEATLETEGTRNEMLEQRIYALEEELKSSRAVQSNLEEESKHLTVAVREREATLESESARNEILEQRIYALEAELKSSRAVQSNLEEEFKHFTAAVRERAAEMVINIVDQAYLRSTETFQYIHNKNISAKRLGSALNRSMEIVSGFNAFANIQGERGIIYAVSLSSCTCDDFAYNHKPCKHMYRLALELGLLLGAGGAEVEEEIAVQLCALTSGQSNAKTTNDILHKKELALEQKELALEQKEIALKQKESALNRLTAETSQSYPWLAGLYADLFYTNDLNTATELRTKQHPAHSAAAEVSRIGKEKRALQQQCKELTYQLYFYETLFPWLCEFKECPPIAAYEYTVETSITDNDEYERLRPWLSPEEYQALSQTEKYQLALRRYEARKKTNWDIGIEYERYIGYLCEQSGYHVSYNGATSKLEDMGRDLILTKGDLVVLVQCKRWAQKKCIHENHVFQLCGSTYEYQAKNPQKNVVGAFVTSTEFSDVARLCGERLGIRLCPGIPFAPYPLVKCNISKTGERIFHLPFDQQYDRIVITEKCGEFYANTIAEAESAGFRRAYTWRAAVGALA